MSHGHEPNKLADQNTDAPPAAHGYEAPRLVELGSLADLTHGGGGGDDQVSGGPES
ncbi:MAG: lasso RiPP family leader peptide-containing protein [Myxococcales bacterium]|nr:lasso RiPP family leader peptide-containing protein [Myxococcales bacterium]